MIAWKRPADQFFIALDFATWPLQSGETLVSSNARGSLAISATDDLGADMAAMLEAPSIVGTTVQWLIKGGVKGRVVTVLVIAPTSDNEILSDEVKIRVV